MSISIVALLALGVIFVLVLAAIVALFKKHKGLAIGVMVLIPLMVMAAIFGVLTISQSRRAPLAARAERDKAMMHMQESRDWHSAREMEHSPEAVEEVLSPRIPLDGDHGPHPSVKPPSAHTPQPVAPLETEAPAVRDVPTVTDEGMPPEPENKPQAIVPPQTSGHLVSTATIDKSAAQSTLSHAPARYKRATNSQPPPPWVTSANTGDETDSLHAFVIVTDPHQTVRDADRELDGRIAVATLELLYDLAGRPPLRIYEENVKDHFGRAYAVLHSMDVSIGDVRRRILTDRYVETLDMDLPVGDVKRIHGRVQFDSDLERELLNQWERQQAEQRLAGIGAVSLGILGLLGVAYGLLKFDTATKGYYTRWIVGGTLGIGVLWLLAVILFA